MEKSSMAKRIVALRQRMRRHPEETPELRPMIEALKNQRREQRRDESLEQYMTDFASVKTRFEEGQDVIQEARKLSKDLSTFLRRCTDQHYGRRLRLDACCSDLKDMITKMAQQISEPKVHLLEENSAFNNRIKDVIIINLGHRDPRDFLNDSRSQFIYIIAKVMKEIQSAIKVVFIIYANFKKEGITYNVPVWTSAIPIYPSDNLNEVWEYIASLLWDKLSDFEQGSSGQEFDIIRYLKLNINAFNPIRIGRSTYCEVPPKIAKSKATLNIKNDDEKCFLWSILAALHPVSNHANRVSSYQRYEHDLKWEEGDFPMTLKSVRKFEKDNDLNIWVFGLNNTDKKIKIFPLYKSKGDQRKEPIDLLVVGSEEVALHFVLIKNISRLLHGQHHWTSGRMRLCRYCLLYQPEEKFLQHQMDCQLLNVLGAVKMPQDPIISFTNYRYKEPVPVVCYADFESILTPLNDGRTRHDPMACGLYIQYQDFMQMESYYTKDVSSTCHEWLIEELKSLAKRLYTYYENFMILDVPTLTSEEQIYHDTATHCHICEEEFDEFDLRVRDHDHWTGFYRGPAHNKCNQNYKDPKIVPVFLHNFSKYDAHFIARALIKHKRQVKVVANNEETLIYCTIYYPEYDIKIRFVDSYRFLPDSLDRLSKNLHPSTKTILRSFFRKEEDFELVCQKGFFCYEYVDKVERLDDTVIPPQEAFHNKFNDTEMSDGDYEHVKKVWQHFLIKNLRQYMKLYMKVDVLILADIFENFRRECRRTYNLDPAHYVTAPSLTYDAALKFTKIKLERLMDQDMYLFVEKSIRGGMVQTCLRHAKAEPGVNCIVYLDVTNLYGWAMSQPLPYSDFTWMPREEWSRIGHEGNEFGYFLEVDLLYPISKHKDHSDFPLAPEHRNVSKSGDKLMLTLYHKYRYVVHHRNLRLYENLGLSVNTVHRVLRFREKPWLKDYVDLNASKRAVAQNDFEKNFYKLMVNALFGKTIENVRKRQDVHLVTKWEGRGGGAELVAKPNFCHSTPINGGKIEEDGGMIKMSKTEVELDKPIYIGASILDISKTLMYDFHYNFVKNQFPTDSPLLYTDTDSLIYLLPVPSIDYLIARDPSRFDTSNYPADHPLFSLQNVKKVGSMKDETDRKAITEFVGLRPKLYAYEVEGDTAKRAKGVRKPQLRKLTIDDYRKCLYDDSVHMVTQQTFQSKGHVIHTTPIRKIGLSANDDKRYCGGKHKIATLPWGHHLIPSDSDGSSSGEV